MRRILIVLALLGLLGLLGGAAAVPASAHHRVVHVGTDDGEITVNGGTTHGSCGHTDVKMETDSGQVCASGNADGLIVSDIGLG